MRSHQGCQAAGGQTHNPHRHRHTCGPFVPLLHFGHKRHLGFTILLSSFGGDCHVSAHKPMESEQKAGGSTELSAAPPSTSVRAAIGTFPLRRRLPDCLVRQGEIFLQLTRRHLTLSLFMRRKPGSSSQAGRGTVEKGKVCSNCGRSRDGVIQTMFSLP